MVDRCLSIPDLYNADNVRDIRSLLVRYFKWSDHSNVGKIKIRQFRRDLNTILKIAKFRDNCFSNPAERLYLNIHLSANRILNHITSFYSYKRANHVSNEIVEEIDEYQSYFDKYNFPQLASYMRCDSNAIIVKEQSNPEVITNDSESYGYNRESSFIELSSNLPRIPLKTQNVHQKPSTMERDHSRDTVIETAGSPRRSGNDGDSSSIGDRSRSHHSRNDDDDYGIRTYLHQNTCRSDVDKQTTDRRRNHNMNYVNDANHNTFTMYPNITMNQNDDNYQPQNQPINESSDYMEIENESAKNATSSNNIKQAPTINQSVARKHSPLNEIVMRGGIPRKVPGFIKKEEDSGGSVKREPPRTNIEGDITRNRFTYGVPPTSTRPTHADRSESPSPPTTRYAPPKELHRPNRESANYKIPKIHEVPVLARPLPYPKTPIQTPIIPPAKPTVSLTPVSLAPAPPNDPPPLPSTPPDTPGVATASQTWMNTKTVPDVSNHGGWKPLYLCRSGSNDDSDGQDRSLTTISEPQSARHRKWRWSR